jgi:signal transduction histidine kinase
VLSNLIENAARYSPPESEIRVSAAVDDGSLRVAVSDQGPGVARDALPRLFEPFFRGARAQRGGSGLGLAVARGLVEAHGGRIWAENQPEGGARFSFELPGVTEAA